MLKILISKLLFIVIVFSFTNAASAFSPCRIEGYSFEISCEEIRIKSQSKINLIDLTLNVHQVDATVRYPQPEPIFWIPDSIAFNTNKRAPAMISLLKRIRNDRSFFWIDFKEVNQAPIACANSDDSESQHQKISTRIDYFYDATFLHQCQKKLATLDFHHFSDENIAQHYEAVRKHLGIKQVVILAEGKGANIALAWQKISPQVIKFQAFDSPVIYQKDYPNERALKLQTVLNAVISRCKKDQKCDAQYPNISNAFEETLASLPIKVDVKDPMTGKSVTMTMDEPLFYLALSNFLSSPNRAHYLPNIFSAMLNHDMQLLIGLLSLNWVKQKPVFNDALYLAEQCLYAQKYAQSHTEHVSKNWFHKMEIARSNKLCHVFADDFTQPNLESTASTSVPTLTFVGGQNPNVASNFNFLNQNSLVFVPNVGAGILSYGCAKDILYRYTKQQVKQPGIINNETLDAACLTNVPLPSRALMD